MSRPVKMLFVGPITRDVTLAVDSIPPAGGSSVASDILVAAGGKGANPAVSACRLGARVQLLGAVGCDEAGDSALAQLEQDGIDVSGVDRRPDATTGQIVHLVEPGGRRRYVESRGANGKLALDPDQIRTRCRAGVVAVVSTAIPHPAAHTAAAAARSAGALVVADLAGEAEASRSVLPLADIVRGDADEIGELTGCEAEDFDSAAVAATRLRQHGPDIAIVQAGDDGDLFLDAHRELRVAYLPVEVVDPTGGGDALIATFATLLARGLAFEPAARLASAAAAHTVSRLGGRPQFAGVNELESLLLAQGPKPERR